MEPDRPARADTASARLLELLECRHRLTVELEPAEARTKRLPFEIRATQQQQATAERAIAETRKEQAATQARLADFDRPLRRRRHRHDIIAARAHRADLPHRLAAAEHVLTAAGQTLTDLHTTATQSQAVLARREDIQARIGDLDDQISHDLNIRVRITRREQPEAIVAVLGPRPSHGHHTHTWDTAVGRLAQHQAAFSIHDGLGPQPGLWDRSAYTDSRQAIAELLQPSERPAMDRAIELPNLSLSL